MPNSSYDTFDDLKVRLDEIVGAVQDESLPLDKALALYEEAVSLGLRASDLLEENIETQRESEKIDAVSSDAIEEDSSCEGTPLVANKADIA